MLKVSYAGCPSLSLAILAQFALEMCVTAKNHQKIYKKNFVWAFKVIEGRSF